MKSIHIGHVTANSWDSGRAYLLGEMLTPDDLVVETNLLEPTSFKVKVLLAEQYKLEKLSQIEVEIKALNLQLDYKDVDFFYCLSKKA